MENKVMSLLVFSSTIIVLALLMKFGGLALTGYIALETDSNKLDLKEFPQLFTEQGVLNGYIVHRGDEDVVAKIKSVLEAKTVSCNNKADKKFEDVTVGSTLNSRFGDEVDSDNLRGMYDSSVRININGVDSSYDLHDEIRIEDTSGFGLHTGLSYDQDEDWEDRVFIPVEAGVLGYYVEFDELLGAGNFIDDASGTDPIVFDFLGQELKIQNADSNSISINVGQRFSLNAGDCVNVNGKGVCLRQTSSSGATVTVDDVYDVIAEDDSEVVNGLEIQIEDVSFDEGIEYDMAILYMGEEARESFSDGEEYIGEDEDDPRWIWDLEDLDTNDPVIGIVWDMSADDADDEGVLYEDSELCLPNDYACLVFDEMLVDDWRDFKLDTGTETLYANVGDVDGEYNSSRVLVFESDDNGFTAGGTKTDTIYIYSTGAGLRLYREESGKAVFFNTDGAGVFTMDYKDTALSVDLNWVAATDTGDITINAPVGDDIVIYIEADPNDVEEFNYIGHSDGDSDTGDDILYGTRDISSYDEDVLSPSCIKILDPESHDSSDKVELSICEDASNFDGKIAFVKKAGSSCFSSINLVDSVHFMEESNMIIVGEFAEPFLTDSMLSKYEESRGMIGLVSKGNMKALVILAHEQSDLLDMVDYLGSDFEDDVLFFE